MLEQPNVADMIFNCIQQKPTTTMIETKTNDTTSKENKTSQNHQPKNANGFLNNKAQTVGCVNNSKRQNIW